MKRQRIQALWRGFVRAAKKEFRIPNNLAFLQVDLTDPEFLRITRGIVPEHDMVVVVYGDTQSGAAQNKSTSFSTATSSRRSAASESLSGSLDGRRGRQ